MEKSRNRGTTRLTVGKLQVTDIQPKIPERFRHLAPTTLTSSHASIILTGCNAAIANAIRRTISNELEVKYLHCEYEDITTDDPYIIPEMIQRRLRSIPLLQSVPSGTKFELETANNTTSVIDVKSRELTVTGGRGKVSAYFDSTYTLFTLLSGRKMTISNIVVKSARGYNDHYGMCVMGVHCTSICKDVVPFNAYTGEGVHTQMADPRVWEVSFRTNGTAAPRDILIAACTDLISRTKSVMDLIHSIVNNKDEYVLSIPGESDSIGNAIVMTMLELHPDIEYTTYTVPTVERVAIIKVKTTDDINTVFKNTIARIIDTFEQIKDMIV